MHKKLKGIGKNNGNLYKLILPKSKTPSLQPSTLSIASASPSPGLICTSHTNSTHFWHKRMGHTPLKLLKLVDAISQQVTPMSNFHCDVCHFAKQSRSSFSLSDSHATEPFALIHCDLWGPYRHKIYSTCSGFLTIMDDCTRCT